MEAAGGAPRVRSEQVEAAEVLPAFASLDIREKEKEKKRAAEVVRIKLTAEAKLLMVAGE